MDSVNAGAARGRRCLSGELALWPLAAIGLIAAAVVRTAQVGHWLYALAPALAAIGACAAPRAVRPRSRTRGLDALVTGGCVLGLVLARLAVPRGLEGAAALLGGFLLAAFMVALRRGLFAARSST